ncbi:MAG: alpha/beta hydrolase [Actinomycetota bacterium]
MRLQIEHGKVESLGDTVYWEYTSTGPGDERPAVVLSHGAGGTHAVWFHQVPALGQDFRIVTWDSRGFGNSTLRGDGPTADQAAADIGAILDRLGIDSAHFVGQSMGGWHNSAFAVAAPERVRSLVYADTVGGLWTDDLRRAMAEFQGRGGLTPGGATIVGGHLALWPGTDDRDPALAFLYQQLGSFHEPPLDRLGQLITFEVAHEAITALDVPVLFVAGEHDDLFPSAALAGSAAMIEGAGFVEIAASGHSPYFEQPDAWNEAVGDFLRSVA